MSIRAKVLLCFVGVLFLFLGVTTFNYVRTQRSHSRLSLFNELFMPLSRQVIQLQAQVYHLVEEMRKNYFQNAQEAGSATFGRMARDLYPYVMQKRFSAIDQLLTRQYEPEWRDLVLELSRMIQSAKDRSADLIAAKEKADFELHYLELRAQLQSISKRVDEESQKLTFGVQEEAKENLMTSLSLSVAVLILGTLSLIFSHKMLHALPLFATSIKKIADGDFHQSLKLKANEKNEITMLAREYNRMLSALRERDKEIQRQQEELLNRERLAAVGQLSAEVVHEIRNPLNAINLNIDWLESELSEANAEIKKTLQSIGREIRRLHQITESYLVRARMPFNETSEAPVNELIREIVSFEREDTKKYDISLKLSESELFIKSDRSRLKQALINLIRNAKEAMPNGGKLSIETAPTDGGARIVIADSGVGMNRATREKSFEPFFTTKHNGTGLGLALTKNIVEEAQGKISLASEMGKGTTFVLEFPHLAGGVA